MKDPSLQAVDSMGTIPHGAGIRQDTIGGYPVELSPHTPKDRIVCHPDVWAPIRSFLVKALGLRMEPNTQSHYQDPTPEMLKDPLWLAIWDEIKTWDINVPTEYAGYCGATGNHVTAIFLAMRERAVAEVKLRHSPFYPDRITRLAPGEPNPFEP
jgi:hypothetical protein